MFLLFMCWSAYGQSKRVLIGNTLLPDELAKTKQHTIDTEKVIASSIEAINSFFASKQINIRCENIQKYPEWNNYFNRTAMFEPDTNTYVIYPYLIASDIDFSIELNFVNPITKESVASFRTLGNSTDAINNLTTKIVFESFKNQVQADALLSYTNKKQSNVIMSNTAWAVQQKKDTINANRSNNFFGFPIETSLKYSDKMDSLNYYLEKLNNSDVEPEQVRYARAIYRLLEDDLVIQELKNANADNKNEYDEAIKRLDEIRKKNNTQGIEKVAQIEQKLITIKAAIPENIWKDLTVEQVQAMQVYFVELSQTLHDINTNTTIIGNITQLQNKISEIKNRLAVIESIKKREKK